MDSAIAQLSVYSNPSDARRALYLISAPPGDINMDMVKELGTHLKSLSPSSVIRSGDYPRDKGTSLDVSVILSEFSDVAKIRNYFTKAISLISVIQKRQEGMRGERSLDGSLKDIPSLFIVSITNLKTRRGTVHCAPASIYFAQAHALIPWRICLTCIFTLL